MWEQARAILWAQFRTTLNFYAKGNRAALWFTAALSAIWYGMCLIGAVALAILFADPDKVRIVERTLPGGLLAACVYWQVVPLMMASAGASLDLKRLAVYPVTRGQLFGLEVLLRFSTGIEMTLLISGAALGLMRNPKMPLWAPLAFLPFIAFNLLLSAGLRDLLGRLLAGKRTREAGILLIVALAALPQLFLLGGTPEWLKPLLSMTSLALLPWNAAGTLAAGRFVWYAPAALALWVGAAYVFGRWQFERGFLVDAAEAKGAGAEADAPSARVVEWLFRLPSRMLRDPLGAIVEKELRFLSRAPRFRLVFAMGFTFGLLIWLPMAMRSGSAGAFASNYLTFVTVYALMLLGEVSFWNTFGFDRAAAQFYYLAPVPVTAVFLGKNIASAIFVFLEISAVTLVCALFRMPITGLKLVESSLVALVLAAFLIGIGNLASIYYPRPVNPANSWRSTSAGKVQAILMFAYPVLGFPIALAYMARYAFETEWAFFGVMGFAVALAATVYWIALESAAEAAERRKDEIVTALSQTDGPVSA